MQAKVLPARALADREARGAAMSSPRGPIRVLAMVEAYSVTGPAKNLIEFASRAASPQGGAPAAELSMVTFQRGSATSENAFVTEVQRAGLRVDILRERRAGDWSILPQLRRLVHEVSPDIIQSHNLKSHFLVRLAGLNRGRRWIAFHHGYTWTDAKMLAYNQLNRWSLPAADAVVTVCAAFARDLERAGVAPDRITVRHNTVKPFLAAPASTVHALRERMGVPPDCCLVLCAGRLSREKGHLDLIAAMAKLRNRPRAIMLAVVGDGPERGRIERMCVRMGLRDDVFLAGHQDDLAPYYSAADLLVLPSHTEGSPNVLLEAMAAGLPIVATAVGGVPEIACDGATALLVPRSDPDALARAIARFMEDPDLRRRFGDAARQESLSYSPERYCADILNLYRSLAGDQEGAGVNRCGSGLPAGGGG